jgi:hypothetical protein
LIFQIAFVKYYLSLTIQPLLDVKGAKSLKNIRVFQSLASEA